MRSTDDLDDQLNCEICAKLIKEKRKVSVNFGSRTIVVDATLEDSVLSVTERIKEAYGLMTEKAKNMFRHLHKPLLFWTSSP